MHPAYLETHFWEEDPCTEWPTQFAIITAYATTGETWTREQNDIADQNLATELRMTGRWLKRLTGYSPETGHAEPGWAVHLSLAEACEIGCRYKQDAIYFVIVGSLHVTPCDSAKRGLVAVGAFRERVSSLPSNHLP